MWTKKGKKTFTYKKMLSGWLAIMLPWLLLLVLLALALLSILLVFLQMVSVGDLKPDPVLWHEDNGRKPWENGRYSILNFFIFSSFCFKAKAYG